MRGDAVGATLRRVLTGVERSLEAGRLAWLDGYPFWLPRLRRWIRAHHTARIEVTVPLGEADATRQALERAGWADVGTRSDADDRRVALAFTARVRSGTDRSATVLARALTVALADAKVRGLHHYVVDMDRHGYQPLPEWRSNDGGTRVFTSGGATSAEAVLRRATGQSAQVQPVGTLSGRLRGAVITARQSLERDPAGGTTLAGAAVLAVVVLVLVQLRWPDDVAGDGYLWLRHGGTAIALLTAAALCAATAVAARRVRAFRHAAMVSGGVAAGVVLGGTAPDLISLQTVYGLAIFGALWILWELAALARWRSLIVALRLGTVAGLVVGYGQWRMALYFAGMGVAAGEVDIPTIDSLTMGLAPLVLFAGPVAVLLLLAWVSSGWFVRLSGVGLTVVAVASAASLVFGRLTADRLLGREVGAGIATPAHPGVRVSPSPTEMCLVSVGSTVTSAETAALTGKLPRDVWRVGTFGQQTLRLDPTEARAAHLRRPLTENVDAPVWYVPTSQVTLRRPSPGAPCNPPP